MKTITLTFELLSYWHIGSGMEAGTYTDALMLKDRHGLPTLPGKTIKGLVRDACQQACNLAWLTDAPANTITQLFGEEGRDGTVLQGRLQFNSASLQPVEIEYFNANCEAKSSLYKVQQAIKIDNNGVTVDGSLRSMEVAIPMTLTASITVAPVINQSAVNDDVIEPQQIATWLTTALPLITQLGAKRHRGLGQVIVTAKVEK